MIASRDDVGTVTDSRHTSCADLHVSATQNHPARCVHVQTPKMLDGIQRVSFAMSRRGPVAWVIEVKDFQQRSTYQEIHQCIVLSLQRAAIGSHIGLRHMIWNAHD